MKKMILWASIVMLAVAGCAQPAEKQYVRKAVRIMDKDGLFAEGKTWEEARFVALKAEPATMEDAQDVVRKALKVAGGKHSFLWTKDQMEERAAEDMETAPSVELRDGGIAVITLPHFSGQNQAENQRYALTVLNALPDSLSGVVIDLRGNTGGNMYPMIAAVHRFLPAGTLLRFKSRKHNMPVMKEYVLQMVAVEAQNQINCPVAILTDENTASSGEAVLLCFRGLDYARSFGAPTAGYASANQPKALPDGSQLVLTISCDVARTGEVFCDDPIAPDVETAQAFEDALVWLKQ
ncbi:MAG: hypothetical protein IJQ69_08980 [Bacteroidales bacterium]|nr:hypothetical protein [Bacteroidales bacterium]